LFLIVIFGIISESSATTTGKKLMLDTKRIVEELKEEKSRLERAIQALDRAASPPKLARKPRVSAQQPAAQQQPVAAKETKRGGMTPEGRKRLSLAMKKRWAERRKKDS
jgi:hypothetical protein